MEQRCLIIGASGGSAVNQNGSIQVSNGTIKFDLPAFALNDLLTPVRKRAPVAETKQITTCTPPDPSADTTFILSISGRSRTTGNYKEWTFRYNATSSDDATSVCDAFRAQINALTDVPVTASGTATLILTGVTGFWIFTVAGDEWTTITTGTPGVIPKGQGDIYNDYSWLVNVPYVNESGNEIVDATNYIEYTFTVNIRSNSGAGESVQAGPVSVTLLVDETNTGFESAFDTLMGVTYES